MYDDLLFQYEPGITIRERLTELSNALWRAFEDNNPVVLNEINNYHPNFIGQSWNEIRSGNFSYSDAPLTIAHQYGYSDWEDVPDDPVDIPFETAVDLLLAGELESLREAIQEDPALVIRQSCYGHEASLLHYVGNNGVELYRQVLPSNLPQILRLLIESGADPNQTMKVYGGAFKMIDLFKTSIHPIDSGMRESVISVYNQLVKEPKV